ncbi:sodium:proton antiporter [Occultella glacieicola]|uniref:Sodium:proton antiporter n=1 Tax=Occultella glacieicola TaxID=2518684 RepID=A0ABY2E3M4_9MICO|nr:DUF6328 family protein [Occultella glacieicola]TDE92720.1 sodium:proton antiporter [Occultella glacieicola]
MDSQEGNRDGRDETDSERADRNWDELMQELRVTQTGTQILTGFLLTLPFQQRFADLRPDQVAIYLVLVALALVATALVVAPVSLHRLLFRRRRKPELVSAGNRLAQVGLVALALVITGTALFVFDVVLGRSAALIAAGSALVVLLGLWVLLPRRLRRG